MGWQKGESGNRAGRKAGTPNKVTAALKEMILGALAAKGGQEYLEKQADENPQAFMTLLGKVLPTTLAGDKENPVQTDSRVTVEFVGASRDPEGV